MDASCSSNLRKVSSEAIETPPNEESRNQSETFEEIEDTIISENISADSSQNTISQDIQDPLDSDITESQNELDRRKNASNIIRDVDLERLEREDFSKEDSLIYVNHSAIVNIKEHLGKITNNDSKPSTSSSSEVVVETERPLTATPSGRYSWNSAPRSIERLSVGAKLNLSASLNRVANEAGPSCARTSHDGPSGSKQGNRLNKSDSSLDVVNESRAFRSGSGVSHIDVNLNGIIAIGNKPNRNVDDVKNNFSSISTGRHNDNDNKLNNVSDVKGNASEQRLTDRDPPEVDILEAREVEIEYEDETYADCEEGTDEEEVCTCADYIDSSENDENSGEEEELPVLDVDSTTFIEMETITQEELLQESHNMAISAEPNDLTRPWRKRKLDKKISDDNEIKKLVLESTPKGSFSYSTVSTCYPASVNRSGGSSSKLNTNLPKTPRSIIPTKDNPPPELTNWLLQFQRWSHVERILAIDRLIERCEPTQIRHMMQVIEPQFQRDFISLLPKEVALSVLSFLEPKDLLRAAQTCRSWRFLADDNLLWKKKCNAAGIFELRDNKKVVFSKLPYTSSPWKAAYMRQHIIEMNWRIQPIRVPKVLKGHDDHVITCLQFSGNRIVSGSDDNTLKVWSAVSGKCLRTLVGHTGGVWSSQMAGNVVISGSTDRTLKVWDVDTGDCTHTLYGHTSTVRCMHLHEDKVVSGSRDATLRVWDITMGTCLHVLVGHLAAVRCVQYDGRLVVSGAYDYMVKVWNPEREECLHTLQGHTNRVYSLQFDGIHVVSGSLDTSIRVWDVETGSCRHTLMGHQSLTSGMELRDNILVSGNADSTVKVWDIVTGQCLQTLSGPNKHQSAVTCLQFNSRFVITSSDDGTVKLWDVKTGDFIRNLVALASGGSGGVVWRIRANETKLICAVGSRNGTEETKLMVLDFDVEGACVKCS